MDTQKSWDNGGYGYIQVWLTTSSTVYTYVVLTSKLRAIWNTVEYLKNEILSV